jgi:D-3-phosphoglycerate dehydrogenase
MHGLGMNVIGFDPVRERRYLPSYIKPVPFEEMLKTADVISIHTPLTEQTSHYIGRKELQMMKKTAYIINTARGGLIDEDALLEALKKNQIAGAGIDVFEEEPPEENLELFQFDNFICTPHMAWYSEESSKELKRKAAEEVLRVLTHKEPEYPINKIPLKLF